MKKTGIFYGSSTGTTEEVAGRIAKLMNVADEDIHNVASTAPDAVAPYDLLVLGTSTWGAGDLQDDWYDFATGLEAMDLSGKEIALFGCGDESMSDTFCGAVGQLYDHVKGTGAKMIGSYPTFGYTFDSSQAVPENAVDAVGLLLDEMNHPEMTDERLEGWTKQILEGK